MLTFKSTFHTSRNLFLIYFITLCPDYNRYAHLLFILPKIALKAIDPGLQVASHCRMVRKIGLLFLTFCRTLRRRRRREVERKDPLDYGEYLVRNGFVGVVQHRLDALLPRNRVNASASIPFLRNKDQLPARPLSHSSGRTCAPSQDLVFLHFHWTFDRDIRRHRNARDYRKARCGKGCIGQNYALSIGVLCIASAAK